jgi:hypothetical protein
MRGWYRSADVLGMAGELVVLEDSSFEATVAFIEQTAGLTRAGVLAG